MADVVALITFSDAAYQTCLMLKVLFGLPLLGTARGTHVGLTNRQDLERLIAEQPAGLPPCGLRPLHRSFALPTLLRDQTTASDMRLNRLVQFDERSRGFPVRALVTKRQPRSYTWRCNLWLNQGVEGACVGAALTHELAARPAEMQGLTMDDARRTYHEAQRIDPWEGGSYPGAAPSYEGTSVLAGVRVLHDRGCFASYRWAFGLSDLILGLGYNGPAVLGLRWYEGMMHTDPDGRIRPIGSQTGGHAILATGVNVRDRTITLRNSWGRKWGCGGDCLISWDDMDRLLHESGEAVFLLRRKTVLSAQ